MDLVTGATGFIGLNLAEELSKRGKVRCLARESSKGLGQLRKLNAEIVFGSLEDRQSLDRATKGVATVFHLAASLNSRNALELQRVNVEGARNLAEACRRNGVKRIVFLSTYLASEQYSSVYGKTKREAEKRVRKSGIPFVIVRASVVYGKHDRRNLAKIISAVRRMPVIPVIGGIKMQPVFILDLVKALLACAAEKKALGNVYNIAGDRVYSFREIVSLIEEAVGVRRIKVPLPFWIAKLLFRPAARLEDMARFSVIDCSRAKKDLGFRATPFALGIKSTLECQ